MAGTIAIIGALEKEVSQIYDTLSERSMVEEAGLTVARGTFEDVQEIGRAHV